MVRDKIVVTEFPYQAMIVAYASYARLFWRGYPPDMPSELTDDEGNLWFSSPNFKNKTVVLTKRIAPFSKLGAKTVEYILEEKDLKYTSIAL